MEPKEDNDEISMSIDTNNPTSNDGPSLTNDVSKTGLHFKINSSINCLHHCY